MMGFMDIPLSARIDLALAPIRTFMRDKKYDRRVSEEEHKLNLEMAGQFHSEFTNYLAQINPLGLAPVRPTSAHVEIIDFLTNHPSNVLNKTSSEKRCEEVPRLAMSHIVRNVPVDEAESHVRMAFSYITWDVNERIPLGGMNAGMFDYLSESPGLPKLNWLFFKNDKPSLDDVTNILVQSQPEDIKIFEDRIVAREHYSDTVRSSQYFSLPAMEGEHSGTTYVYACNPEHSRTERKQSASVFSLAEDSI